MKPNPLLLQLQTIKKYKTAALCDTGNTKPIIAEDRSVETKEPKGIKVRVHIPENVLETVRQQKINKIYDILNLKNSL